MLNNCTMSSAMPTKGQFVEMWVYEGVLWSSTYRHRDDLLERYDEEGDQWVEEVYVHSDEKPQNCFLTLEESYES